ncbi:molybdopterin molybdochelatase [Bryocella elongata]|uniref:Molybdopterin molybdenumtransferase n=1 Tax=Bryocella elongata TaxID=863522 RepID=A0A1H6AKL2_9BACT|nr:molybdopterin molybdochelatase [Bryocella elongata]
MPAPLERERIGLRDADGRLLAEPIYADRDQPPFDRSTRDGYAVRAAELSAGTALHIIGSLRAGELWSGPAISSGEALEIMTGAPVPEGADCVAMLEHVLRNGDNLSAQPARTWKPGENIVPRGAEAHAGDVVLPSGRTVGPAEVAVAATSGCATLEVYARPRVAIIATGDELVGIAQQPEPWQIRNSNSWSLASLVSAAGGSPERLAIARDELDDLRERIAQGSMWDLLVLSGGVSMGKHDLVEQVLTECGAEFFFTGAWIQPGKPVVFGRLPKSGIVYHPSRAREFENWQGEWTYFFGLPGNPVSTEVCFHLFVAPLLRALGGRADLAPAFVEARLAEDVKGAGARTRFLPAQLTSAWDGVTVKLVPWQGSGDVAASARAGCFCVLPPSSEALRAGDTVRVLLR